MKRKGSQSLLVGGVCLFLGIGITFVSFAAAADNERFYIMTGLLGVGVISLGRGIYWMMKASGQWRATNLDVDSED